MVNSATHHWRLYGTLGCHLCELAMQVIAQLQRDFSITIESIDIADDPSLMSALAERIPVLENTKSHQQLPWPFDPEVLSDWLME